MKRCRKTFEACQQQGGAETPPKLDLEVVDVLPLPTTKLGPEIHPPKSGAVLSHQVRFGKTAQENLNNSRLCTYPVVGQPTEPVDLYKLRNPRKANLLLYVTQ